VSVLATAVVGFVVMATLPFYRHHRTTAARAAAATPPVSPTPSFTRTPTEEEDTSEPLLREERLERIMASLRSAVPASASSSTTLKRPARLYHYGAALPRAKPLLERHRFGWVAA
jgi:hypothetical protein